MTAQASDLADGGLEAQLGRNALVELHPGDGQSTGIFERQLDCNGFPQEGPPAIIA